MGNTALTTKDNYEMLEKALIQGDLSQLTSQERLSYYDRVCQSLGLNPLTKPFDYLNLNGKIVLYAKRDCTDQLRKNHGISIKIAAREKVEDLYIVIAQGTNKDGRVDESIGAVSISNLRGEALANAIMKTETKAKRRVTLSLAGLGWLDETEIETIPDAEIIKTPEIPPAKEAAKPAQKSTKPDDVINESDRRKLFALKKNKEEEAIIRNTTAEFGYDSTKNIQSKDFGKIYAKAESEIYAYRLQQETTDVKAPREEETQ